MRHRLGVRAGILLFIVSLLVVTVKFMFFQYHGGSAGFTRDLDNNGKIENYLLEKGQLTVREGNRLLWKTSEDWTIQSCHTADADNDGFEELLLVLWKKGSFGSSRPMWQKGKDDAYSNHLFLYRLVSGKIKPVWCSSALVHPIINLEVQDINQDGKNELKVVEGPSAGPAYNLRQQFSRRSTNWVWQGWGFVQI